MSSPPPDYPSREQLAAAIAALEPYATHPDTGAIHDPLYELMQDPDTESLVAAHAALWRLKRHPAHDAIRDVLGDAFDLPPLDLREVLDQLGPSTHDDPVLEVQHRLTRAAADKRLLLDRVKVQALELDRAARTVNALSLVGALLTLFALAGWLGALDLWQIEWFTPPEPPANVVPPEP